MMYILGCIVMAAMFIAISYIEKEDVPLLKLLVMTAFSWVGVGIVGLVYLLLKTVQFFEKGEDIIVFNFSGKNKEEKE